MISSTYNVSSAILGTCNYGSVPENVPIEKSAIMNYENGRLPVGDFGVVALRIMNSLYKWLWWLVLLQYLVAMIWMDLAVAIVLPLLGERRFRWKWGAPTVFVCGKSEQRGLLVNHTQSKIFGRFASGLCESLTSQRMMHMKGEVQVQKFQTTEMTTNDPIIER